jgi:uncharacterized protein (TIGR02001 family)
MLIALFNPFSLWAEEAKEVMEEVEEDRPTIGADVAFLSQYIWRGLEFSDSSLVIQPSITAGYKGFSLNLWGNLDTSFDDGVEKKSTLNETDVTFGYDTTIGDLFNVGGGYIYYGLDGIDDTYEFYGTLGLNVLLAPTLTVYRDIGSVQGWYIHLGISHSFALPHEMSLDLAGSVAYYHSDSDNLLEYDDSLQPTTDRYRSLHDGNLSARLTIPFAEYFSVTPTVAYSFPLSSDADNLIEATSLSGNSSFFYGGVVFSMAF